MKMITDKIKYTLLTNDEINKENDFLQNVNSRVLDEASKNPDSSYITSDYEIARNHMLVLDALVNNDLTHLKQEIKDNDPYFQEDSPDYNGNENELDSYIYLLTNSLKAAIVQADVLYDLIIKCIIDHKALDSIDYDTYNLYKQLWDVNLSHLKFNGLEHFLSVNKDTLKEMFDLPKDSEFHLTNNEEPIVSNSLPILYPNYLALLNHLSRISVPFDKNDEDTRFIDPNNLNYVNYAFMNKIKNIKEHGTLEQKTQLDTLEQVLAKYGLHLDYHFVRIMNLHDDHVQNGNLHTEDIDDTFDLIFDTNPFIVKEDWIKDKTMSNISKLVYVAENQAKNELKEETINKLS